MRKKRYVIKLGYQPLGSRVNKTPYIVGVDANVDTIKGALKEITTYTANGGYGVVYFATHGTLASDGSDVTLAVGDRPVTDTDGLRMIQDVISILVNGKWELDNHLGIANFLVAIDACNSGGPFKELNSVMSVGSVQRVIHSGGPSLPKRITLITATSADQEAYSFKDIQLTGFGAFFARALQEDWTCADSNEDGVITAAELMTYLRTSLYQTQKLGGMTALMVPQGIDSQGVIATYNADYYRHLGERLALDLVVVEPDVAVPGPQSNPAQVTFSDGVTVACTGGCRVPIPTSLAGTITATAFVLKNPGPVLPPASPPSSPSFPGGTADIQVPFESLNWEKRTSWCHSQN